MERDSFVAPVGIFIQLQRIDLSVYLFFIDANQITF